ncbi:MAG: saccharopine dehydrogenase NADP-binding domain-containing protein [Pseudomonadales bacterium]|jgi:short subunit dehydrogenase-like uncharacterized protein|nr:saccharopine dehydrogenase NADP-binding domain-containing protein [Pseudomonadales bacterium]
MKARAGKDHRIEPHHLTSRLYAFVILGATGFTGRGVCRYLQSRLSGSTRWAIAGRDQATLDAVVGELCLDTSPETLVLETSPSNINSIVAQADILINLAGPYSRIGDEVVAACVSAGTHYVDICGELDLIANWVTLHHDRARERKIRVIPAAGFESLMFDLSTRASIEALGDMSGEGDLAVSVLFSLVGVKPGQMGSLLSAGTLATFIDGLERRVPLDLLFDPFCLTPGGKDPSMQEANGINLSARYDTDYRVWCAPLIPGPFINPAIAHRTNHLLSQSGEGYGSRFSYQEAMNVSALVPLPWIQTAAAFSLVALTRQYLDAISDYRDDKLAAIVNMLKRKASTGRKPLESELDEISYQLDLEAVTSNGRHTARLRVRGMGHPGYRSTANIIGEAILTLVDGSELSNEFGVVTPAVAFGTQFLYGLEEAGISTRVIE